MAEESRYRLATIVCLLLLAGFIGNSISNYLVSRHNVRKTITESSLPLTSDNIYSVIQRDLLQPIFISSMMSNDAFLRDWVMKGEQDPFQIERYLSEIKREYNTIASFLVSEKTRNYYYSGGILKQVKPDEPRDEWYFRVRQMEEPFEINVDPDLANQDAMTIFINYRVFDFEGNYIGATGTGLTVNRVNQLIEEYEERFSRQIFFCNKKGDIILSPRKSDLKNQRNLRDIPGLQNHVNYLLSGEAHTLEYRKNGQNYFLNTRYIPELEWFLMVEQTEDILLAPLRNNLYLGIALAVGITAIVAFICIGAVQRYNKRLHTRNRELSAMNEEIKHQKKLLEKSANDLAKANQSLSALNQEKDDFLGIVAHDLRNPLSVILTFSDEILANLSPQEEAKYKELLTDINSAGNRMLELIGDILNVAIIENAHEDHLHLTPHNLNELVKKSCNQFRSQAEQKNIHLEMNLAPAADCLVETRSTWVEICLNNLISNALKYSPLASTITIDTKRDQDDVLIGIRDEGPGLSAEDKQMLFQKFARLSARPTGPESSTGLGLYIVKKMCGRLNAEIAIDSVSGSGAYFYIRHPIKHSWQSTDQGILRPR